MKTIGLIGGLSPESTAHYYKVICSEFNRRQGGLRFPQMVIRSISLQDLVDLFPQNRWDDVAAIILSAAGDLKRAGADFAAIAANTPHNAYEKISQDSPLPLLSIMEATAGGILKAGLRKVGLLGTKPTMEYGFFQKTFERHGIETLVPEEAERDYIDRTVWKELSLGIFRDETKKEYLEIIGRLKESGAQGMILGCTEIPLLLAGKDIGVPAFDTADMHARAIVEYALAE